MTDEGYRRTAEISVVATNAVHALIKVTDADGASIGQTVLPLPLPWLQPDRPTGGGFGGFGAEGTRSIEMELTLMGQSVGMLSADITVTWSVPASAAAAATAALDENSAIVSALQSPSITRSVREVLGGRRSAGAERSCQVVPTSGAGALSRLDEAAVTHANSLALCEPSTSG